MGFTFAHPIWLFLLLGLPVFYALSRRVLYKQGGSSHVWLWRAISLALLILALAAPMWQKSGRQLAVLVDVSESVAGGGMAAFNELETSTLPKPPKVIFFAGDATLARADNSNNPSSIRSYITPEQTDIANALRLATAQSSTKSATQSAVAQGIGEGVARVLLISDGIASTGNIRNLPTNIPIDVYQVPNVQNVRLDGLFAPSEAAPGATINVTAIIESDYDTIANINLSVAGNFLESKELSLKAGRTPVDFELLVPVSEVENFANLDITAQLETPQSDQPTSDDSYGINIAISQDPAILVINDPAMATFLSTQGFKVFLQDAKAVTTPLDYSAIVLREGMDAFTPGQLELLADYVKDGGGLLMTGGPDSFGMGGWYRTPVEEVLPVSSDLRSDVEVPLVAMIIIMDKSGSMDVGRPSKISLAKEGALGVVELAYERDRLGLITFNDESEWAFNLRYATERGKREMLQAILNIRTDGGTILRPAYEEALAVMQQTDASVKHIIILSDGQLYDDQSIIQDPNAQDFTQLAASAAQDNITTSTIALGDNADFVKLKSMAQAGKGRYYAAVDASTLPRIFTTEALTATRSLLREGNMSVTAYPHPLAPKNFSPSLVVPPLDAYVASTAKEDTAIILEGKAKEPILAVRRQGLGRTAAFTTDLNLWAGEFGTWQDLPPLLSTVVRWLQTRPETYSAAVRLTPDKHLQVTVDAVENGKYVNNLRLETRYQGDTQTLTQVAPGRYQATLTTPISGGEVVIVQDNEIVAKARVTQPSGEFATADHSFLPALAAKTGGNVLHTLQGYTPELTARVYSPLWMWLVLAAGVVFLLELIARRFFM